MNSESDIDEAVLEVALLGRGVAPDSATPERAWARFVDRYAPRILSYIRSMGASDADAEDLTQEVLIRIFKNLRTYQYQPSASFRAYLRTVVRNAYVDYVRASQRRQKVESDFASTLEESSIEQHISDLLDVTLIEEAMARVKAICSEQHWAVFARTVLEGCSAAEIAEEFGLTRANVYMIRSRVQKQLRNELARLDSPRLGDESQESEARLLLEQIRTARNNWRTAETQIKETHASLDRMHREHEELLRRLEGQR